MNKRAIGATIGLERAKIIRDIKLTQGDRKSHVIYVGLGQDVEVANYELLVFFSLPLSSQVTTVVDKYVLDQSKNVEIIIPDIALKRTGTLTVEFALKHLTEDSILTVSEKLELEVIGTINGAILEALPGENIQLHIDQQLEKIDELLKQADNKVSEYNNNAVDKTTAFNDNYNEKLELFNQNVTDKTEEMIISANNKATELATNAAEAATNKIAAQQKISIKAVTDEATKQVNAITTKSGAEIERIQGTTNQEVTKVTQEGNNQLGAITAKAGAEIERIQGTTNQEVTKVTQEGSKQVKAVTTKATEQIDLVSSEGRKQIGNVENQGNISKKLVEDAGTTVIESTTTALNQEKEKVVTGAKEEINTYVDSTSKTSIETYVNNTSKPDIDGYIENTTKPGINAYIEEKKADLKGDPGEQGLPGRDLLNELQGTIGMKFDENLTYLNDPGTKKLGFCYLDKLTDGIFECIKETTTTVNDLSCFVNFSNKENSDRLSNLGSLLDLTFETYDSASNATVSTEPYLALQISGKTKYIGFTKDFDSHKASPLHFKIDNEEYALRKYTIKNFADYMSKVYPSTYQTMTKLPADFPDMSDATSLNSTFYKCYELLELTDEKLSFGNATRLDQTFRGTKKLQKIKDFDYSNITSMNTTFYATGLKKIGVMNTVKCTEFSYCFRKSQIETIDSIDLSAVITFNDSNFTSMFSDTKIKKVTFNNVPAGITVEQMRTATSAPSTCEIILNHRAE